jgi:hypothetical protein
MALLLMAALLAACSARERQTTISAGLPEITVNKPPT